MTIEHNDFHQGSGSGSNDEPHQRPQYYGSGLGNESFVEDDDDYEFLLDEALARDGLYRGSYNLLFLYTVVALTFCLALVPRPTLVFTTQTPSIFPYTSYFLSPFSRH